MISACTCLVAFIVVEAEVIECNVANISIDVM